MLSYRHSFHAGNFADVLKHTVQSLIIQALRQKPKPFVYIDTHAGAGRYDLSSENSQKIAEYKCGIEKIFSNNNPPESLKPYLNIIHELNPDNIIRYYPGSPLLAKKLMPKDCHLALSELHPADYELLLQEFNPYRNVQVKKMDGYQALMALLPPIQRRGLIFIDPSYEVKSEYQTLVQVIKKAYRKFPTGIYAIWYPVLGRAAIESFCQQFKPLGISKILRIELNVKADNAKPEIGFGMTGTGMLVINPPWKLTEQMQQLLPWLLQQLKQDEQANYILEWLARTGEC